MHTTGIFVRRTLGSFRLPPECLGPAVRHVTLYSPARRPLRLVSPRDEFRIGRMASLYEHELGRARTAGTEWAPGYRLEGLESLRSSTLDEVYEGEHRFTQRSPGVYLRHNVLCRREFDALENLVTDTLVAENHALLMYQPFLPAPDPGPPGTVDGAP